MRKFAAFCLGILSFAVLIVITVGAARAQTAPGPKAAHPLAGCFAGISASGQFLTPDRVATGAVELGCDLVKAGLFQIGMATRYDLAENSSVNAGSIAMRAGFLLNPHVSLYGLTEWRVKDFKFASNGSAYLGAGVETTVVTDQLSAFAEASTSVSKFGAEAYSRDDIQVRVGVRYRFNGMLP